MTISQNAGVLITVGGMTTLTQFLELLPQWMLQLDRTMLVLHWLMDQFGAGG